MNRSRSRCNKQATHYSCVHIIIIRQRWLEERMMRKSKERREMCMCLCDETTSEVR